MDITKLKTMIQMECAAIERWKKMSAEERAAYAKAYPQSRFVNQAFLDHIKKGALHEKLGIPEDEHIPEKRLQSAKHSRDPEERKEATLAENMKHWDHHHSSDEERRMADQRDAFGFVPSKPGASNVYRATPRKVGEETVPLGNGKSIPRSKVTKSLSGWK